ncbi:putative 2,3-bisphosphoglycerate-dependent phosphoglycerate mutase [Wickerhamomyces ciferrii]|uniref:2,3-bisphosphoglycerate-dependent phosphoglycerate mutase n=1 Tax=Wickerhamomyces ciferrii (strain ATCC 14091 / BCRC 22168 / CBS 111 / JCM 3599 / NBRC 0793 / NRRL Y-1031 F-60-10) TaxID=1206466 RepID=K0KMA3_WICCF|nr:putative 2,3-bisphosphoglycerate-dependent phosphoglycerate mutase [Wickerhamomyces ciferrii]CCH43317.1 putative 2,3-bisphosphoglycerate-dependent phosphoglycerate mutase [Wickerhamomyces ciferrii]
MVYIPTLIKYATAFTATSFTSKNYFKQYEDSSIITTEQDNFGLRTDKFPNGFNDLIKKLDSKNAEDPSKKRKLIFLARHGEGWHNVLGNELKDWNDISKHDTYENYTLFDADLTPKGESEIKDLHQYWVKQLNDGSVPYPETFYVSPLTRTIHTFNLTFQNESINALIDEDLRERYGEQTPEKRHNKTYIHEVLLPQGSFIEPFTEQDELWKPDEEESNKHVRERVTKWLTQLFEDDELVISVTSHGGTISQILKVIGHPKYSLKPGQLIPVVVKAKSK